MTNGGVGAPSPLIITDRPPAGYLGRAGTPARSLRRPGGLILLLGLGAPYPASIEGEGGRTRPPQYRDGGRVLIIKGLGATAPPARMGARVPRSWDPGTGAGQGSPRVNVGLGPGARM